VSVRVVVAEDEAIIRLDLVEILREEGYEVVADCGRGDEVVQLVEQHAPDLVLLDIKMPGMDGLSAARAINEHFDAAIVILTAFSQRDLIDEASDAGAMSYLVKPYQRSDLVPALELARARRQERQALTEKVGELESRMAERKLIDRSKGLLMDTHGMSEDDAFRFLQRSAMSGRSRMSDVAHEVLSGRLAP
jgi:AmiR/NasT family two-component response regulator